MSIFLVMLMFIAVLAFGLLLKPREQLRPAPLDVQPRARPVIATQPGTDIPEAYRFHPCHTWAVDEGGEAVRVGLDSFAAGLFERVERIDLPALNCWIRQGQNFMTVRGDGITVDFPSPVEGCLTEINRAVVRNPEQMSSDPYCDGWVAVLKSPCFAVDKKNLMHGCIVPHWMRTSEVILQDICSSSPVLAQDGGTALRGILKRVSPEVRSRVLKELFMTNPIVHEQRRGR